MMLIPQLENTLDKGDKVKEAMHKEVKATNVLNNTTSFSKIKESETLELLTNNIIEDKGKQHQHAKKSNCATHGMCINFLLGLTS